MMVMMIDCSGNDNDDDGTKGDDHEKKEADCS